MVKIWPLSLFNEIICINLVFIRRWSNFAVKFSYDMDNNVLESNKQSFGKKIISYSIKYLLPLFLTIALVYYMFEKVNFSDMMDIIRGGVNYWWILLAMGISLLSHIFRALRWRLQLRGLNINPSLMALSCSIFGTYALNLVFPRLGEVWRCTYISQREKAPFTSVFGSMVADRLADTATVLLLTILTFVVASSALTAFLTKYPIGQGIVGLMSNVWFWLACIALVLIMWLCFRGFRNTKFVQKIVSLLSELWAGFVVVTKMKGRGLFLFYTLCIWGCYFSQLYVAFYAFSYTAELCFAEGNALGLIPCLVAFVFSSIGMAVPSNGGLGPWNIAVMFGLAIYGISDAEGTAFSMLVWSAQTVMLIILGIYTMIYISVGKKRVASN